MANQNLTDAEIIEGLQVPGSKQSIYEDTLYIKFSYFIEEARRKFSLVQEDAFSCYSDSIITTLENIRSRKFEGRSSLKTYLYQIFHNKCVDQVRKNTTKKSEVHHATTITDLFHTLSDSSKNIIQKLTEKSDMDELRRKLQELGENCRKMLMLFSDGYSDREIAEMLEFKTHEVAKTSRLRCLEKLRRLYQTKQ